MMEFSLHFAFSVHHCLLVSCHFYNIFFVSCCSWIGDDSDRLVYYLVLSVMFVLFRHLCLYFFVLYVCAVL